MNMKSGLRLLVCTQVIDRGDPALGFFHQWVEKLAERHEHVHVICLKEGEHRLPSNVSVYSLGKETGRSLFKYISRFYRFVWLLRREHGPVFVHMNAEYVVLGGLFWRLWGKRVVLWRNHRKGGAMIRTAALFSDAICYTSPASFTAHYAHAVRMPIGIDTEQFSAGQTREDPLSILFFGRLDPVKYPHAFVTALGILHRQGVLFHATICGDPTKADDPYAKKVKESAAFLVEQGKLKFLPAIPHGETPALFQKYAIYVNLTPSGSFDKTIGEALASGCVVVTANAVVKDILPEPLFVQDISAEETARAIKAALEMPEVERNAARIRGREYVEREHSLTLLMERLMRILA